MSLRVFMPDAAPADGSRDWLHQLAIDYLAARSPELARRSISEHWVTIRKWDRFWAHRLDRPMRVGPSPAAVLAEFLDWIAAEARAGGAADPARVTNKAREHCRAWLRRALESGAVAELPRLPRARAARGAADLVAFTPGEIDVLYRAAAAMPDPRGWSQPFPHALYWRAAIVFLWTYGVDTQTVFRREIDACPVTWSDCLPEGPKPDGSGLDSPHGWIWYRRQKTGVAFLRPITPALARHLAAIRPDSPAGPIFRTTREPARVFAGLVRSAGLVGRLNVQTRQQIPWTIKHFRKTAAENYENYCAGAGSAVLGHADDRVSRVTGRHYASREQLAHRAILALEPPESFT